MSSKSMLEPQRIFPDFKFNYDDLLSWLKAKDLKLVSLQVPEGLKRQAVALVDSIETELGITVILVADPCFGACDIGVEKQVALGVEAIIHIGHSEIPDCAQPGLPIKFIELQFDRDVSELIQNKKKLDNLRLVFNPPCSIGLLTNVQFITQLEKVASILGREDFKVYIGTGDTRIKHPGQVLGCNFSAARAVQDEVDGFLFIGDGMFHPLGIGLTTAKKVLVFNPIADRFQDVDDMKIKIMRQRNAVIGAAKPCTNFGILVTTKHGQTRLGFARELKTKLTRHSRRGTLLALDNVIPNQIDYLPFEAYINTACPRLAIDDYAMFKKPIITPMELEIILGEREWENYTFDEIR
ncbi:diphthamide biosynthesis enzyme Dph2 [[Eubacterium] cellulosolvens]